MDAINPINPSALFMIKGADQTIYTTNGGQGFVTDQQLITAAQCSNPNAFFRSLLAKSYSTQVHLSSILHDCNLTIGVPHLLGASSGLPWQLYKSISYMATAIHTCQLTAN